jgi:hypothetical protein
VDLIGIQLLGRLGNQMFQYAAARAAAERLGCGLFVRGPDFDYGWTPRRMAKNLWRSTLACKQVQSDIGLVFPNVAQSATSVAMRLAGDTFRRRIFPRTFAPRVANRNGSTIEVFDPDYFRITPSTWLNGFFQSEAYFADMKSDVRSWFDFSDSDKSHVRDVVKHWPAPQDRMCAIHVRRTDYLRKRDALSHPELGWALPITFYERAFSLLPPGLSFAIFSDDIEFARNAFHPLRPWLSQGNTTIQDLALMSSCRFQVIANSSFSWWAAWLNSIPDKLVIAPNFHLGCHIREWFPGGVKVDGWSYVDVS